MRIIDAVLAAANELAGDTLPTAPCRTDQSQSVGASIARVDGIERVSGTASFAADTSPPDSLWLRIVRSPHAHATFTLGELDGLYAQFPGLVRILTAADIPGHNGFGIYPHIKDQPVLAAGRVLYRGEPVLALIGDRVTVESINWDLLPIDWQVLEAVADTAQALDPGATQLHPECTGNVLIEGRTERGGS